MGTSARAGAVGARRTHLEVGALVARHQEQLERRDEKEGSDVRRGDARAGRGRGGFGGFGFERGTHVGSRVSTRGAGDDARGASRVARRRSVVVRAR
eukprot:30135-Pelagococcus_subviridis.AAC.9